MVREGSVVLEVLVELAVQPLRVELVVQVGLLHQQLGLVLEVLGPLRYPCLDFLLVLLDFLVRPSEVNCHRIFRLHFRSLCFLVITLLIERLVLRYLLGLDFRSDWPFRELDLQEVLLVVVPVQELQRLPVQEVLVLLARCRPVVTFVVQIVI